MRNEYDFSRGKRNPYAKKLEKKITINIDESAIDMGQTPENYERLTKEDEPISVYYYEQPNPYKVAPSCNVNLLELSRYAKRVGKKLADLTKEEIKQFKI